MFLSNLRVTRLHQHWQQSFFQLVFASMEFGFWKKLFILSWNMFSFSLIYLLIHFILTNQLLCTRHFLNCGCYSSESWQNIHFATWNSNNKINQQMRPKKQVRKSLGCWQQQQWQQQQLQACTVCNSMHVSQCLCGPLSLRTLPTLSLFRGEHLNWSSPLQ